jgi:hypothetical protein
VTVTSVTHPENVANEPHGIFLPSLFSRLPLKSGGLQTLYKRLALYARMSTPRGREIVLEILKSSYPAPIHAREIFERVRKEYADEKLIEPLPVAPIPAGVDARASNSDDVANLEHPPPYPEHPIRSFK